VNHQEIAIGCYHAWRPLETRGKRFRDTETPLSPWRDKSAVMNVSWGPTFSGNREIALIEQGVHRL